ncbi:hypothetical protein [Acetilactobacillus jinshanensis]|uniref:Uncharacterized protein n=1 Tax=Acetilactobacillus jinshanensis TaxID=1720083 RepID=A0A4P6ZLG1_9LACO|nr:hypothetical protein [Acetilactobacillus jinshanensis]QBP18518.1 hypothetical protein ELX58_05100 [Acetilactobacillus jinshanensis]
MTNQVILYDRLANVVKLIDGIKSISLKKAQQMGFTPAYLMQIACNLLSLDNDKQSQQALKLVEAALQKCPTSKYDHVGYIISYDRMSDKVKIFGGAITVPFKIALHKGITPEHMIQMAIQLLSLHDDSKSKVALSSAKEAQEACHIVQETQPKYKNKRYR